MLDSFCHPPWHHGAAKTALTISWGLAKIPICPLSTTSTTFHPGLTTESVAFSLSDPIVQALSDDLLTADQVLCSTAVIRPGLKARRNRTIGRSADGRRPTCKRFVVLCA